jgi:hypothetical protein
MDTMFKNLIEERRVEAARALVNQRRDLDTDIANERKACADTYAVVRSEVKDEIKRSSDFQAQKDTDREERFKKFRLENDKRFAQMSDTQMRDRTETLSAAASLRQALTEEYDQMQGFFMRRFQEDERQIQKLWDNVRECQELPCRRVEWIIPQASIALALPLDSDQPYVSWFSRPFRAGGTRNLRLELRRFKSGALDCGVQLWAGRGIHMHYRLMVGEKWSTCEKLFKDRSCHGIRKLAKLEEQINKEDDTLRVGVELLETINEMDAESYALRDADDEEHAATDEVVDAPNLGSMMFHRHVNHRLVPQIRTEIERLGARLVRRVEWNVEMASKLSHYFQARESICSPAFACAGMMGFQLLFYPSGYTGATEGFCSFFLYAPAGITLKGQLQVGNQIRDIINTYETNGAYGRTNFCRFDSTLWDPQDDILPLSFQVFEISMEQGATSTHESTGGGGASAPSAIKLVKVPAKDSLVDTKVLPALWTAKGLGDHSTPDEGFDYFSGMSTRRQTAAVKAQNPFRPLESGAKIIARSESSPQLSPTQARAPATGFFEADGNASANAQATYAMSTSPAGWPGSGAAADAGSGGGGGGGSTGTLPLIKPPPGARKNQGSSGLPVPLPPASLSSSTISPLGQMKIPYVAGFT